ncbi:Gfo/Idh/MocA family protein [Neomoorella thermoacetica]|uniref:Gfo/Idh/MocA family protein n=1 Tax=Neomoorella thermoacetica TaxID=1525 RepID=UPI0008FA95A5|nr:Gfo/Idh/MocA family oxidoreductase [Moorella thermoacetica]OIQ12671.1 glucose--fructose oxidoreductase precursor [Moorella thermoacetica]
MTVGIIGAGNWGKNLVRTFFSLGRLAGVAEVNPATRQWLAAAYPGLPVYSDYGDLLACDIAAVAIATPAATHYQVAREALLAGKDVFVEKPLALSRAEAEELVALAESKNRILMVGHLLLYQPAVQWLKRYLESGAIGPVAFLTQERLKLGRVRPVENVMWSFGVHDIAVLLYLVGQKPQQVKAYGRCFLQKEIEDDVYLHLRFPGGIAAHLHVSWLWPEQRRLLTIVGSKAMLVYDEVQQRLTLYKKRVTPDLQSEDAGSEVVFQGDGEPLLLECRHFLDRVADRRRPLSDGRGALDVIAVLEEAEKQLKEDGTWIGRIILSTNQPASMPGPGWAKGQESGTSAT